MLLLFKVDKWSENSRYEFISFAGTGSIEILDTRTGKIYSLKKDEKTKKIIWKKLTDSVED